MKRLTGKYSVDDGGLGENNDCGVRALMVAVKCSYEQAWQALFDAGRQPCKGTNTCQMRKALVSMGYTPRKGEYFRGRSATLAQWGREVSPTGNYLVLVTGHWVTVQNGVLHDWAWRTSGMRRHVVYWFDLGDIEG